MPTRELETPPRILPLYARAIAPLLPGASRLPWVSGSGGEIPDSELVLCDVRVDPERVADYARVCGFSARGSSPGDELPATYAHLLAFPLHLALMTDGRFPLGAIGLVHVGNRITQHRPIRLDERLELRVRATPLENHPRGQTFSLLSEARIEDELVWEELSTMLHRSRRAETSTPRAEAGEPDSPPGPPPHSLPGALPDSLPGPLPDSLPVVAEWRLPGDLGRRYAAVSGDRNPIHMHPLSARAFGFPRAIAHGMWTMARCLAALEEIGAAFRIDVRFRRPILLPATVGFASAAEGDLVGFCVREVDGDSAHLEGQLQPIGQPRRRPGVAQ
jgi:MaoC like domain